MPTLSPKAWIAIGLLVLLSVGFGIIKYQNHEIADLNKENGAAAVHVETADKAVELKDESSKVDDKHVTDFVKEDHQVKQVTDKRIKDTHIKVEQIEKAAEALPATPESVAATDTEVSKVRITALWDSYCAAKAGAADCPAPQPTQEKQNVSQTHEEAPLDLDAA